MPVTGRISPVTLTQAPREVAVLSPQTLCQPSLRLTMSSDESCCTSAPGMWYPRAISGFNVGSDWPLPCTADTAWTADSSTSCPKLLCHVAVSG